MRVYRHFSQNTAQAITAVPMGLLSASPFVSLVLRITGDYD
jgi:hypothetical protein